MDEETSNALSASTLEELRRLIYELAPEAAEGGGHIAEVACIVRISKPIPEEEVREVHGHDPRTSEYVLVGSKAFTQHEWLGWASKMELLACDWEGDDE